MEQTIEEEWAEWREGTLRWLESLEPEDLGWVIAAALAYRYKEVEPC